MSTFKYTARSRTGERVEGTVEAGDKHAALAAVGRMDCVPISVAEVSAAAAARAAPARKDRRDRKEKKESRPKTAGAEAPRKRFSLTFHRDDKPRMSMGELLTFTRELSDLLASGMTLGEALHTLAQRGEEGAKSRTMITALRDDIVRGSSLSEALGQYPEIFPTLYVSMVRAGEAGGSLGEALQRLAHHFERAQDAREKVVMALTYPGIVLIIGMVTMTFVLVYVVPRFSAMFAELGSQLPLPTRMLIGVSKMFTGVRGLLALAVLVAGIVGARRALKTEKGRRWWHRTQLRVPVVRRVVSAAAYTHFAQTLSSLLSNGVPVLQALSIVEKTVGNSIIADEIRQARERVTDGSTISGPLAAGKVFPTLLTDMLAVGERTGDMAGALTHIARRYESELDRSVKLFITVLEPLLIVLIAALVGFVAISMLIAVFDLTSGLNA